MDLRSTLRTIVAAHAPEVLNLFRRARRTAKNHLFSPTRAFDRIYRENLWGSSESRSGSGSTAEATSTLCRDLPPLLVRLGIRTLLDAPCGDFWIRRADLHLEHYIGIDAVDALIRENARAYGAPSRTFKVLDLTVKVPPRADLILCRDLFIHLSYRHAWRVLVNFRQSGSEYLLCSQCPSLSVNEDIVTGSFRPVNLRRAPFNFPAPMLELDDSPLAPGPTASRRTMALWRLADLPIP